MGKSIFTNPIFHDEDKAREWLEARLWKDGPICPKCGTINEATLMQGKSHRAGLYQCNACREPFTVTVGTLYERSKIPLYKWLAATYLMMASKNGISALEIGRLLDISPKSSWFLCHRIRESLRNADFSPFGGEGKWVEVDETFVGGKEANKHSKKRKSSNIGGKGKAVVFSLVERKGQVRSKHVPNVSAKTLRPILVAQVNEKTSLMTDDAGQYRHMKDDFPEHQTVNHSKNEYVRGEAHANTIEGYFSTLKRGIIGTFHHVSPQHLERYLAEFDYRYNERSALGVDDAKRFENSLGGIVGKRLTYKHVNEKAKS